MGKIEMVNDDVAMLKDMCGILKEASERARDKSMNQTLFALSLITAVFLPMQFITGLYGMNFVKDDGSPNIPELTWERGYYYFWGLEAFVFILGCFILWVLSGGDKAIKGWCRSCCCQRSHSKTKVVPRA